jgi:acyl carrier protein
MTDFQAIDTKIRNVLSEHAQLSVGIQQLGIDDDLTHSGLTSLSSVNVMLALESLFDIEFPDHMLNKKVFSSIGTIRAAIVELTA